MKDIDLEMKKSYCLSKTITSCVNTVLEEDLFIHENVLHLNFTSSNYFFTSVESVIFEQCRELNIEVKKSFMSTQMFFSIENLNEYYIIAKIPVNILKYNKVYTLGGESMHYIRVLGKKGQHTLFIQDCLIPTNPYTTMTFDIEMDDSRSFEFFFIPNKLHIKFLKSYDIKVKIGKAIEKGKEEYKNLNKYISILEDYLTQDNAMDIAIDFVTSGYVSSRIMIYKNVNRFYHVANQDNEKCLDVLKKMVNCDFNLRIFLSKLHFKHSDKLKKIILLEFRKISLLEVELMGCLYNILKGEMRNGYI